jgi:hypothetical protein
VPALPLAVSVIDGSPVSRLVPLVLLLPWWLWPPTFGAPGAQLPHYAPGGLWVSPMGLRLR